MTTKELEWKARLVPVNSSLLKFFIKELWDNYHLATDLQQAGLQLGIFRRSPLTRRDIEELKEEGEWLCEKVGDDYIEINGAFFEEGNEN